MAKAIISPLITLPQPRGFWDYALFASATTGFLIFLFWLEATDGFRWADVVFAIAAAALFVVAIVLARKAEKAEWISQRRKSTQLLFLLGILGFWFGSVHVDAYLFHRTGITLARALHDVVLAFVCIAVTMWSWRSLPPTSRQR